MDITSKLHATFSNIPVSMIIVGIVMFIWFKFQTKRDKDTTNMIVKNSLFASILTGIIIYYVKSGSSLLEDIDIRPADF